METLTHAELPGVACGSPIVLWAHWSQFPLPGLAETTAVALPVVGFGVWKLGFAGNNEIVSAGGKPPVPYM